MKRIKLIINPNAGFGLGRYYLPKIKSFFENKNIKLDIFETTAPKQAIKEAKKSKNKYDIIIAAGGDGTINEVINGIIGGKASLAIIPLGTANVLAKQFDIPDNIEQACKLILSKKPKKVDIGIANNRYFLLCCGIGFDAKVIHDINIKLKQKTGKLLFYLNMIKNLFTYNLPKLRIIIDNKVTNGYTAVVLNSKYYGGKYILSEKTKINDGLLEILVIGKNSPLPIIQVIFSAFIFGKVLDFDDINIYQGKNIKIQSLNKKAYAHTDAELIGTTPVKIKVLHNKLKVIY